MGRQCTGIYLLTFSLSKLQNNTLRFLLYLPPALSIQWDMPTMHALAFFHFWRISSVKKSTVVTLCSCPHTGLIYHIYDISYISYIIYHISYMRQCLIHFSCYLGYNSIAMETEFPLGTNSGV